MPRSDDHPIRITAPEYKPSGQGELEQWLSKEAESRGPKIEDNENDTTAAYSDLYEKPKGRKDGSNVDGSWGEPPNKDNGRQEPFHQNDRTYLNAQHERREVTQHVFDMFPAAEKAEQALLSANLEHARRGDFTAHSVLLQSKTKEGGVSLSQRVRALLNRF